MEQETTRSTMEFLEEVFSRNYSNEVKVAAIYSWGLLATTVSPKTLDGYSARFWII